MLGEAFPADPHHGAMLSRWMTTYSLQPPDGSLTHRQSTWDKPQIDKITADLDAGFPDSLHQARLKAVSAPHAGDWLLALPITSCGLRLDDESVRVAVGLRLGVPLCEPHRCPCGAPVAADGLHGLSCSLGPGRNARHAALNDIIFRSLTRAGFPSSKEPVGLLRADGKRPDGLTLIPWHAGRCLI